MIYKRQADVTEPVQPSNNPGRPFSSLRSIVLGACLIPVNVYWVTIGEVRWGDLDGTALPLFITPVFLLFLLVLLNLLWRKLKSPAVPALRQEELLIVYVMLVISCTFAGQDTLQNLFGVITHPYWYANPSNGWQDLFFRYLPKWLFVTNHDANYGLYNGGVAIFGPNGRRYLISWLVPLAAWGVFFLTLFGMYLCLTTLVRRAWIDNEKLSFPIVQLPIAMTADDAGEVFFKNPILWAGFGVAFFLSAFSGLHTLFPAVPSINIKTNDIEGYFNAPPWNAIGATHTSFYPFAIGIAYFMPLDLSLSCWVFYILARVFRIGGAALGYMPHANGFPYFGEQGAGAWLGLAVMLLYAGRAYWRSVWETALKGVHSSDPVEAIRYRAALAGLIAGALILAGFSALIGMSAWAALVFYGIVFLLGFVITRVRAEFGTPHEISWVNPGQVMVSVFGTSALGPQNLTLLSMLYWFNRGYRNHPMPNQLEAFKMLGGRRNVRFSAITGAICLAAAVSLLSTYAANLQVTYAAGAAVKVVDFKGFVGMETFHRLQTWLTQPAPPASTGLYYVLGGFLFVVVLSLMRSSIDWWPLHPAGYALAISYSMEYFWLPVFIAWLAKLLITRYGGMKLYRTMIPFFLGLILGDYTTGSLWSLLGWVLGVPTYRIYI